MTRWAAGGRAGGKCAEVTESTRVSPATNLVFLAPSYDVGTRRQFSVQGTHGCAGTSGQGAGDGGFSGAGPCHAAGAGLHPRSGVSQCLSKDTAPKVCREQIAAPPRVQVCSAAAGVPPAAPGVHRDLSWSRRRHYTTGQSRDPGQRRPELQTH